MHRLSLGVASGGHSTVAVRGLLTAVSSLGVEHGFCVHGLRQLWHTGPQQSGSVVIGAQV